jgi:hypothetical protein
MVNQCVELMACYVISHLICGVYHKNHALYS